jgi:hypothetical protein
MIRPSLLRTKPPLLSPPRLAPSAVLHKVCPAAWFNFITSRKAIASQRRIAPLHKGWPVCCYAPSDLGAERKVVAAQSRLGCGMGIGISHGFATIGTIEPIADVVDLVLGAE